MIDPPLLHRVASGDSLAMRDCIDRYGGLIWALARRFAGSHSEAEDAVQEIFVQLWKNAARYNSAISSETTFVAMIARRRLIDRKRRLMREPITEVLDGPALAEPGGASRVEACVEAQLANKALLQLRPEQRNVLVLSACHGLTHEEISEKMNMPLGTVKAHARRGLIRIRELLRHSTPLEGLP